MDNNIDFLLRVVLENTVNQYVSLRCVDLASDRIFINKSNIHYIIHSQSTARKYKNGLYNDILTLYKSNKEFLLNLDKLDYDIKASDILLIIELITLLIMNLN